MSRLFPAELPPTWTTVTFGEIAETVRGVTYKKENSSEIEKPGLLPILRATNIDGDLNFSDLVYVPKGNVNAKQLLQQGDIVIAASSGSKSVVGKAAILKQSWQGSFGAFCLVLRPSSLINARFLAFFLQTFEYRNQVSELSAGVNINNLRREHIEGIRVRLAPHKEQIRIVAEIEKQFTRLDAAVAALKRAQANLKRYRAAVLRSACEGRLVPTETELARREGRSYEPANELLKRILAERRFRWEAAYLSKVSKGGKVAPSDNWKGKYPEPEFHEVGVQGCIPEGWVWATVDQLSVVVRGASPRPAGSPKYFGGQIPWITVGALTKDDQPFLHAVAETVTEAGKGASRYIEPDTLLLTNSGATLGVPKITMIGGCINDGSVALLYLDYPTKLYLYYFLKSQTLILRRINQGAAQPNLNTTIVKGIVVPLPPLSEQGRIVQEIQLRFSVIDELEFQINTNIKRADRLRQAILKRAFEGSLVLQDPNDESASVLLERIRTSRNAAHESAPTAQRGTRKRDATHVS